MSVFAPTSAPIYRIKSWGAHFENSRTREMKVMAWVPIPNKMDGDGYTELVSHENGGAHLGAWLAIVEIASRCEPRGTLARGDGRSHDPVSLSRISRLPAPLFEEVFPRLLEIGWLEVVNAENEPLSTSPQEGAAPPQANASAPQEGAASRARAERNGRERMERNGTEGRWPAAARPPCASFN